MCDPAAPVAIGPSTVPVEIFTRTMLPVDSDVTTTRDSSPGRKLAPCGRVNSPSEIVFLTVPAGMSITAS